MTVNQVEPPFVVFLRPLNWSTVNIVNVSFGWTRISRSNDGRTGGSELQFAPLSRDTQMRLSFPCTKTVLGLMGFNPTAAPGPLNFFCQTLNCELDSEKERNRSGTAHKSATRYESFIVHT